MPEFKFNRALRTFEDFDNLMSAYGVSSYQIEEVGIYELEIRVPRHFKEGELLGRNIELCRLAMVRFTLFSGLD